MEDCTTADPAVDGPIKVAFVSSNATWGGSEELWSQAAEAMRRRGAVVIAYKNRLHLRDGNVSSLRSLGCESVELASFPFVPKGLFGLFARFWPYLSYGYQAVHLGLQLKLRGRPDLVVLSQGGNHDGWHLGAVCRRLGLPYVLINQKATDLYWPTDSKRGEIIELYQAARHVFFVSEHNLGLTCEQLGQNLPHASVVRNPFAVAWNAAPPWPATTGIFRLACVGRLYPKEKGQDILLRILAAEKWRGRPVSLTVFGSGEQREGLTSMARYLGLKNVRFAGFSSDIRSVWADHHALVLPSRAEGLPLVLVEAMLSERIAIVTDIGGNAEVVGDNVTGFLAAAPTEASFDEALERAWQHRDEWKDIGQAAGRSIRTLVPPDPVARLCDSLTRLARAPMPSQPMTAPWAPELAPQTLS